MKRSEYPATFGHISDAIDLGHAKVVTINEAAKANRKTSLKNIKTKPVMIVMNGLWRCLKKAVMALA
jgi:hypothetical protein